MPKMLTPDDKLIAAAQGGDVAALVAAVHAGADCNARCEDGAPALNWLASGPGRAEAIAWLISRGADPRLADHEGATALMCAAHGADPATLVVLVASGADPAARNNAELSPLAFALHVGQLDNARALLALGARIERDLPANPVKFAAQDPCQLPMLKGLLALGCDADERDAFGHTPLMVAARNANLEGVLALLGAHADPRLANRSRRRAIDHVPAEPPAEKRADAWRIARLLAEREREQIEAAARSDLGASAPGPAPAPALIAERPRPRAALRI